MNIKHKNLVIVGGGAVGMLMALALAKLGREITLIEKLPSCDDNCVDGRSIALSYTSICMLESLGVWARIKHEIEKIEHIHVSDKGLYGQVNLSAKDEGLPFLGVVIKMQHVLPKLIDALSVHKNIELWSNAKVIDLMDCNGQYTLILKSKDDIYSLHADLIIAADGAKSLLREKMAIDSYIHDYGQSALIFDVLLHKNHQNCAYERFINNGVMAMLPVGQKRVACVWSVAHQAVSQLRAMDKSDLLKMLQQIFSYRLGRFLDITNMHSFPLSLVQAKTLYKKNILLFGNASHFLHPISGQGLNLSIRDIGVLHDLMLDKEKLTSAVVANLLETYTSLRDFDHKRTVWVTHSMINIFTQQQWGIKKLRSLALHCLERDKFLKAAFSELMMGKLSYGSTLMQHKVY
ncbi:FAD-dependent monooxygenase [Fastidiosibacter lacustris]|uniref:FAD-dependent monooxygenase n=1 Tax=Fastidiosibacter lacustris TaxID=2056695 RepID=UPI000E3488F0|nr:FAD-dependent monooxygenase [Fastidiosibacter lacustris]